MENSETFVLYKTCFARQYEKQAVHVGPEFQTLVWLFTVLHMNLFSSICAIPKLVFHISDQLIWEAKYIHWICVTFPWSF